MTITAHNRSERAHDVLRQARSNPLDAIFSPKTVAVIGATERAGSVGCAVLKNLSSFHGTVYPVNPKRGSVLGIQAFPNLAAVPEQVDLAVIVTPAPTVPGIIRECAQAAVPGALIISAGFKECGPAGVELENQVLAEAHRSSMRIIGPNCLGVMSPHGNFNATFAAAMARPGNVAFISQSGALCTAILDWSVKENVGFSAFVSIGSMLDVVWGDLITYFGDDPHTKSIVCYMESVGHARSFLSAAREVALTKPIIVLKVGHTEAAAKAAASHTGVLTGSDAVLDAAFRRVGVLRVDSIEELFDMAEVLAKQPRPRGSRLAIITNAGGPGALATDALVAGGGHLAKLSPETTKALSQFLAPHWSHGNPIDILGDADAERYARAVELAAKDTQTDGVLAILTPQAMTDAAGTAERLRAFARLDGKPILASWMGGPAVDAGEAILNNASIPTFKYPDRAARAFDLMWRYSDRLRALYETPGLSDEAHERTSTVGQAIPPHHEPGPLTPSLSPSAGETAGQRVSARTGEGVVHGFKARINVSGDSQPGRSTPVSRADDLIKKARLAGRTLLTEVESKQVLDGYGIKTVETHVAFTEEDAVKRAEEVGYPVVLKLFSETLTHKSDVGGVQLDLRNATAVRQAWRHIHTSVTEKAGQQHFLGVTVQPMVKRDGYEVIFGSSVDPQFGPVLLFGAGGQLVEVFKDNALGFPPLNATLALRLMEQTRIYSALKGVRGRGAVDLDELAQVLVRFSQLVAEQPWISEVDINPLLVAPGQIIALDARIVFHPPGTREDQLPKLAIRPYPARYVLPWKLKDGSAVSIRPIRPEDEPLMVKFHQTISERSVYLRYFGPLKLDQRIAHERLSRLCFIDYDREMALIVERRDPKSGHPEILGVGRLSKLHGINNAEFALVVSDSWQGHGLGTQLLRMLVQVGRDEKLERITATILPDNREMQHVSRKVGFDLHRDPSASEVQAILVL
jgi:acetyltransferase